MVKYIILAVNDRSGKREELFAVSASTPEQAKTKAWAMMDKSFKATVRKDTLEAKEKIDS